MFSYQVNQSIQLALMQPHNALEIYELVNDNKSYLRKWLGWVDQINSPEDYRDTIIPMWLKQFADLNGFNAGIYYDNQLVGMISLHFINRKTNYTSIGYYLAEEFQGRGIVIRCVRALLEYAFTVLELNKVEIQCATDNLKSRKVPEKLGFTMEGTTRDAEYINGQYNDIATYSLLREEWTPKMNKDECQTAFQNK